VNSDDRLARLAGLLYLILLPTTGPAYFSGQAAMAGDAAATLANIEASRSLFELGTVVGAVGFIDFLALGLVLYAVFSPVSKDAASLMLVFIAASVPLSLAAMARRIDVLSLLDRAAVGGDQLQAQVMLAMHSSNNLMLTSIIFWGLWIIPLGWLIIRSGYVPRVLGILLILGSFFYLMTFVGTVLDSSYSDTLPSRIIGIVSGIPGVIGELGTALWLLIMGRRKHS
jgi:hypothetical protein